MKKKVLLGLLLSTALIGMAGCNDEKKNEENKGENKQEQKVETKRLTCSMTDEDKTKTRYTLTYEDGKFTKASLMVTAEYKSDKETEKEYNKLKEEIKKVNEGKGVSANAQTSGKTVSGSYTFTISNLDDKGKKTFEEAGLEELDGKSYDDAKNILEKASFTCN